MRQAVRSTTIARVSSRTHHTSNAKFTLPPIKGEPFLHYGPGSAERANLEKALYEVRKKIVEIPCIVNGKEYFTGE
jgi:1-pyrroline-5-carboxylate dehydrogenase